MIRPASQPAIAWIAIGVFCLGVLVTALRTVKQYQTPGPFDPAAQGMCDFHNGIYFPTRALIAGISPYGNEYATDYPVARQIPFFSPGILVLHAPLAVLPLRWAEVLYFALCVAMVVGIATLAAHAAGVGGRVEWIAGLAALIVFSRGGHITLFDGYFTFELILATFLAIRFADRRPWLAATALAVVSAKPTFILPLGFLLLARGNLRALILGATLSVLAAGLPLGWLAYHEGIRQTGSVDLSAGLEKVIDDIGIAQEVHMSEPDESPLHSWTRLDLLAGICKWTGSEPGQPVHLAVMFVMLAFPMWLLLRRMRARHDDGLGGGTGALIVLTLLSSLYHQSYDALLLVAPLAAATASREVFWSTMSSATRCVLIVLLAIPLLNYLSTRMFLSRVDFGEVGFRILTSVNAFVIAAAWALVCVSVWLGGHRDRVKR